MINTPTVTATKWWIGGAGQTATHAVVYARLIIEGKDYGVQVCFACTVVVWQRGEGQGEGGGVF